MSLRKWITAKRRTEFTSVLHSNVPTMRSYLSQTQRVKRERGEYGTYSSALRLKIGKYGLLHGATQAARHFSKTLDKKINESTVHRMVKAYQEL